MTCLLGSCSLPSAEWTVPRKGRHRDPSEMVAVAVGKGEAGRIGRFCGQSPLDLLMVGHGGPGKQKDKKDS